MNLSTFIAELNDHISVFVDRVIDVTLDAVGIEDDDPRRAEITARVRSELGLDRDQ